MQLNEIKTIGWIGTGVMGKSMCQHLLKFGYNLNIYNRTQSKTDELIKLGAKFMPPKEIAQQSDIVILMVGFPKDVEELVFGEESNLLENMKKGSILIDHTTSSPTLAKQISLKAEEKGIMVLDAPVSGGDIGAREGKLVIMCGGNKKAFTIAEQIFKVYGKQYLLQSEEPGSGQHCKMVNQIAITGQMLGMVECLLYAQKAGLDLQKVLDNISGGAAASFSLSNYAPRILKGDYNPGFFVEHFVKDMKIALDECEKMRLCLPGLALVKQLYQAVMAQGGQKLGTQALMKALEAVNQMKLKETN